MRTLSLSRIAVAVGLGIVSITLTVDTNGGPVQAEAPTSPVSDVCTSGAPNLILGTDGDDDLEGTDGDDIICGFGGDDKIDGGNGHDILIGGPGHDELYGGNGNDEIHAGDGDNTIDDANGNDLITAGSGNDEISDSNGHDEIHAGDGNNKIDSGNGNDLVTAGDGDDEIKTDSGNDTVHAGNGNNLIETGNGNDRATSGTGNDQIDTDNGNDVIFAGAGDDTILTGNGKDTVFAGGGNDYVDADNGKDSIDGGSGIDEVIGGNGFDRCASAEVQQSCATEVLFDEPELATVGVASEQLAPSAEELRRDALTEIVAADSPSLADAAALALAAPVLFVEGDLPSSEASSRAVFSLDGTVVGNAVLTIVNGDSNTSLEASLSQLLAAHRIATSTTVEYAAAVAGLSGDDVEGSFPAGSQRETAQAAVLRAIDGNVALRNGDVMSALAMWEEAQLLAWALLSQVDLEFSLESDADDDGLPDLLELWKGSSPLLEDTDGDGLSDRFEAVLGAPALRPNFADSDVNGTPDGDEDGDNDGWPNLVEQTRGTSPFSSDSDGDGLLDPDEDQYGTDPANEDTDSDGIRDGAEVSGGTDPLTPNAGETSSTVVADGGVEVTVTGPPELVAQTIVEPVVLTDANAVGRVGDVYDIYLPEGSPPFTTATLSFPFDPTSVTDPQQVGVFWFNEDIHAWVPQASTVDTDENSVSAVVEHFSLYAVFDLILWANNIASVEQLCRPGSDGGGVGEDETVAVAFVIDSSGSMSSTDPSNLRRSASAQYIEALSDGDYVTVVDFDSRAVVWQPLTTDRDAAIQALQRIDSRGLTNIGAGVSAGLNQLRSAPAEVEQRFLILLTDGIGSYSPSITTQAIQDGVTIFTIGLSAGVDDELLSEIADETGGAYFPVATADDLPDAFRDIEDDTINANDEDEDGLTDCEEVNGIRDWNGDLFTSDPFDSDTDGDGIDDGEEIGPAVDFSGSLPSDLVVDARRFVRRVVYSDPDDADSDDDEVEDGDELDAGTKPRNPDSDFDGLTDSEERSEGSNPNRRDSDGDGFDDLFERTNRVWGFHLLHPDRGVEGQDVLTEFYLARDVGWVGTDGLEELADFFEDEFDYDWDYTSAYSFLGYVQQQSSEPKNLAEELFVTAIESHLARSDINEALAPPPGRVFYEQYMMGLYRPELEDDWRLDWRGRSYEGIASAPDGIFGDNFALMNVRKGDQLFEALVYIEPTSAVDVLAEYVEAGLPDGQAWMAVHDLEPIDIDNNDAFDTYADWLDAELAGSYDWVLGDGATTLFDYGFDIDSLSRLTRGRTSLVELEAAVAGAAPVGADTGRFFSSWRVAERYLRETIAPPPTEQGERGFTTTLGRRTPDQVDPDDGIHEAKSGFILGTEPGGQSLARQQAPKDAEIVANGDASSVTWHFFPSGASDTIMTGPSIFALLNSLDIPYILYPGTAS